MLRRLKNTYARRRLRDPRYRNLFDDHPDEIVSLDCETTSLNVKEAEIISIGAVILRGNTLLTSQPFYEVIKPEGMMQAANVTIHGLRPKDLSHGIPVEEGIRRFLDFAGGRPLLGYYLEYDIAMINKFLKPLLGIRLPQRQIEVSRLYHAQENRKSPYDMHIDLRMATMIHTLNIPDLPRHDALNDAINVAMMYLALKARKR